MNKRRFIAAMFLISGIFVFAAEVPVAVQESEETKSLLGDTGPFSFTFGLTNIYQQNLRGGLSTNDRHGRFAGSYDMEMSVDLKRLLGIDNAELYTHIEGWWPRTEGIDSVSTGSFFGVNGDAGSRDAAVVTEVWYQQMFFDGDLTLRVGKMDLTGGFECSGCPVSFDCNPYANDETQQFLNSSLVNNSTIPFPVYTLGVAAHYAPGNDWYITAAAADSLGDYRETGFRTAFHDEDNFFYIAETGITPTIDSSRGPLQGVYAVGVWYLPERISVSVPEGDDERPERDNAGVYVSCGQMLIKENDGQDDSQGLGTFFRYGYAPSSKNDLTQFYSTGLSYQGLPGGRDNDVLALGLSRGYFNDSAGVYTEDSETVYETFYNIEMSEWMTLTPSIQYVADPSSADNGRELKDAVIFGLRAQMVF
jgi:carbohydrate-selective porin OprB